MKYFCRQTISFMKNILLPLLLFVGFTGSAQYYYKDVVGTKESAQIISAYQNNNVKRVLVNSYDAQNTKVDDLFVEQIYNSSLRMLKTVTRSAGTDASVLSSFADEAGRVIKTVDSTGNMSSTTTYKYNADGSLASLKSVSNDTSRQLNEVEEHLWYYQDGKIDRMLRIKNGIDTTYVQFKLDANGNVIEEQSTRKGVRSEPVYYYYDAANRLTDIVRYNNKARRLLPEYMFEYSPQNQVIQRITVPANSDDYLIWRYQYDAGGLKIREAVYNKAKELNGKIEYQYQRG